MTVYTEDIRRAVRRIPVPESFNMEVVEYADTPVPFLMLRFYSDQWYGYTDLQRGRCAEYLAKVQQAIGEHGVQATLDPIFRPR